MVAVLFPFFQCVVKAQRVCGLASHTHDRNVTQNLLTPDFLTLASYLFCLFVRPWYCCVWLIACFLSFQDMALVAPEAPSEQARRVFQTYDPEGKRLYYFIING